MGRGESGEVLAVNRMPQGGERAFTHLEEGDREERGLGSVGG